MSLIALKCVVCLVSTTEDSKNIDNNQVIASEVNKKISELVISLLLKGLVKNQDEFLYCKVS